MTENKFFAVRLTEYNKGTGALLRQWTHGPSKLQFKAGESTPKRPFIPSPVVEVTQKQYEYIMGRSGEGVPNVSQPRSSGVPAFQGWTFSSRQELIAMVQNEADQRASRGRTGARALLVLHEEVPMPTKKIVVDVKPPVEPPVEPPSKVQPVTTADGSFKPVDVGAELEANAPEQREAPTISRREAARQYKENKDGKTTDPTKPQMEEKDETDKAADESKDNAAPQTKKTTKQKKRQYSKRKVKDSRNGKGGK